MIEDEIKVKIAAKVKEKLGIVVEKPGVSIGSKAQASIFGSMFQEIFARQQATPQPPSPSKSPGKRKKKAGKLSHAATFMQYKPVKCLA